MARQKRKKGKYILYVMGQSVKNAKKDLGITKYSEFEVRKYKKGRIK